MRKAIFLFFLLLGIGAGYLSARNDDWGLCVVMMAVGALFGAVASGYRGMVDAWRNSCSAFTRNMHAD